MENKDSYEVLSLPAGQSLTEYSWQQENGVLDILRS